MTIKRPMKAPSVPIHNDELTSLHYPILGSPKLDGFRCIIDERGPLTSSMKPFQNRFIQNVLSDPLYYGLDGEIIVGEPTDPDVFHNTTGPVRRFDGEPDFRFYAFDSPIQGDQSYKKRWLDRPHPKDPRRIVILEQRLLLCADDVIAYEQEMLELGYEGAMIRSLDGKYKQGRCTLSEMNIFKRKPYAECEAIILEIEEQMENLNEKFTDERGLSKRSSHQENKKPKNTLGMFNLKSDLWEKSFKSSPGKGFDDVRKQEIWDNKEEYIGKTVTVKYQAYGSWDRPRQPGVIKIHIDGKE